MIKKLFAPLAAAALFLLPATASGQQINFDEFTSPPVTCCYGNPVQGPLFYPEVVIQDGFGGGTVMNGSGWLNAQTSGQNLFGTLSGRMVIFFPGQQANGLSLDIINGLISGYAFTVNIYGIDTMFIASNSIALAPFGQPGSVGNVSFSNAGIWRVDISGSDNFAIDTLNYNTGAVPEPGTWALMLLGFGLMGRGLRASQRRRKPTGLNA